MGTAFIISLLAIGIILLLIEILLVPGIGVSGVLGLAALVYGCYMSFGTFGTTTGLCITAGIFLLLLLLLCYVLREKTWLKFALETKVESSAGQDSEASVKVGQEGVAITRLAPMGTARIEGKNLEVKSADGFVDQGTEIVVAEILENIIIVKIK